MLEELREFFIAVHQLCSAAHHATVSPVLVLLPEVALNRIAYTAVFAKNIDKLALKGVHRRLRVVVAVLDIAAEVEVTAGRLVDQARRVYLASKLDDLTGVELAPGLVERHPNHYALEALEGLDYFTPLLVVIVLPFLRDNAVGSAEETVHRPLVGLAGNNIGIPGSFREPFGGNVTNARHILPNQHSFHVSVVVPSCGLNLDVLAYHIVAPFSGLDDVEAESLIGRSGIESVRPPSLIERSELEQLLAVERHTLVVALVPAN